MKHKIPWKNPWAKYRSIDADGTLWEHEKKPMALSDDGCWVALGGRYDVISRDYWEKTLEARDDDS